MNTQPKIEPINEPIVVKTHLRKTLLSYGQQNSHTKHINALKRNFIWLISFAYDKRIPIGPAMMPKNGPYKPAKNFSKLKLKFAKLIIKPSKRIEQSKFVMQILTKGAYCGHPARPMSEFDLCNFEFMIHIVSLRIYSWVLRTPSRGYVSN